MSAKEEVDDAAEIAAAAAEKASYVKWIVPSSMTTASISFVASITIIIMIFRSNLKLTTIYRRLIFGLSVFDLIQSFSQLTGSLLMPKESYLPIAIGNDITCSISGFLVIIGITGAALYSVSISVYFLCIAKFEMEEKNIRKYVEPFLHGIPIFYSLGVAIYILSIGYINPPGFSCWINPPDDGNPMDRDYARAGMLRWVATAGPLIVAFVSSCIILGVIYWTVYSQSKLMSQFYGSASANRQQSPPRRSRNHEEEHIGQGERKAIEEGRFSISCALKSLFQRSKPTTEQEGRGRGRGQDHQSSPSRGMASPRSHASSASPLAARLSRPSRGTMQMLKEISRRAAAYIVGYSLTYTFSIIHEAQIGYTGRSFIALSVLSRLLLPLQGLFNLLTYTYPHVITYRRRHDGTSLLRAFWEVIKSGGDSDQAHPNRRKMPKGIRNRKSKFVQKRRDSLRKEPAVLDVEQNFAHDAERIRTTYNHGTTNVGSDHQPKEEEKRQIGDEDSDADDNVVKDDNFYDNAKKDDTHERNSLRSESGILDYGQSYEQILNENNLERFVQENGLELYDSENDPELSWDGGSELEQEVREVVNEKNSDVANDNH